MEKEQTRERERYRRPIARVGIASGQKEFLLDPLRKSRPAAMEGDVHGGAGDASRMAACGGLIPQEHIKEIIQQIEQHDNAGCAAALNERVETSICEAHKARTCEGARPAG